VLMHVVPNKKNRTTKLKQALQRCLVSCDFM